MIRNSNIIDRLYLAQGDEDTIYIDNEKIPQHTIDGIRFLYKQFRRRKSGVILNDPFSFGRNIQICLFLKAIRPLLHRPILILCQEGSEQEWIDRFDTWTNESLFNEVAIETVKPFTNKMVMINTMVNLHLFCAREWSIIIVDGDHVTTPNPILKLPFKACFKIWNTSVDMKKNLDRFEEVYRWLYPRAPFDKNYFITDSATGVDVIEKAILIDTLCEDILLRRDCQNSSSENLHRACEKTPQKCVTTITVIGPTTPPPYRIVGDTSIHPVRRSTVASLPVPPKTVGLTTEAATTGDSIILQNTHRYGDTTITPTNGATFVGVSTTKAPSIVAPSIVTPSTSSGPTLTITKKNKDATGTKIKRSKTRIESETTNKTFTPPLAVLTKLLGESPKPEEDATFCSTIDFSIENYKRKSGQNNGQQNTENSKTMTDKQIDIIEIDEKPDPVAQILGNKLEELDTIVFGHDTLISKVSAIDISAKGYNTPLDRKETEPHTILTCKPVGEHNTRNKLFTDNKRSTTTITSETSSRCSDSTERDKKNDRKMLKSKSKVSADKPEVGITNINLDELNSEMSDLGTKDKTEQLVKRQKTTDNSETATCCDEIIKKFSEQNKQTSVSCSKVTTTEQVANNLKRINVDEQMKECEETVAKKFKGSLLDSLF